MAKAKKIKDPEVKNTLTDQTSKSPLPANEPAAPYQAHPEFYSRFTDFDISLFKAGKHFKLYEKMGAHVIEHAGQRGTYFAVWAPNARSVSVMGNFNGWNRKSVPMNPRWDGSGIWETFVPVIGNG